MTMMRSLRFLAPALVLVLAGLQAGSGLPDALAQAKTKGDDLRGLVHPQRVHGARLTAVEKGFFEGLDVKVVGGGPGLSSIDRVMAESKGGGIAFGVDYPYNAAGGAGEAEAPARRVVSHDFQKSGGAPHLVEGDQEPAKDIEGTGRDLDRLRQAGEGRRSGRGLGEAAVKVVNQQGDPATIGSWLEKDHPFAHAMIYNEILVAKRTGRATAATSTYSFSDFGIDWPENVVFTTEDTIKKNPKVVQAFWRAVQGLQARAGQPGRGRPRPHQVQQQPEGAGEARTEGMEAIASVMVTADLAAPRGSATSILPGGTGSPAT